MNFATVVRTAAAVAFVAAAVWGQSSAAYAEEIVVESRDQAAINHGTTVLAWARVDGVSPSTEQASAGCCDDVVVDGTIITGENFDAQDYLLWRHHTGSGTIITGENYDAQAGSTDSEWKYISVRR